MELRTTVGHEPNGVCWGESFSGASSAWQLKQVANGSFCFSTNRAVQPNGCHQRLSTRGHQSVWLDTTHTEVLTAAHSVRPDPSPSPNNFIFFCKLFLLPEISKPRLLGCLSFRIPFRKHLLWEALPGSWPHTCLQTSFQMSLGTSWARPSTSTAWDLNKYLKINEWMEWLTIQFPEWSEQCLLNENSSINNQANKQSIVNSICWQGT